MIIRKYPYLANTQFLKMIDSYPNKHTYTNITVLDWNENPVQNIQSKTISGSINVDGSSSMRRTGNLTLMVLDEYADYYNIDNLISINKKIYVEIGFKNIWKNEYTDYSNYDYIMFPQGIFLITDLTINHSLSEGLQMSLSIQDKMCLLNGTLGGTLGAASIISEYDVYEPENGGVITKKTPLADIVREVVHHFGGEDISKVIVKDLDSLWKTAKWVDLTSLVTNGTTMNLQYPIDSYKGNYEFLNSSYVQNGTTKLNTDFIVEYPLYEVNNGSTSIIDNTTSTFKYKQFSGYTTDTPVFPTELQVSANQNVTDVLDSIVSQLGGEYEYYYDIDGFFIFQEKRNYLNTNEASVFIKDYLKGSNSSGYDTNSQYLIDRTDGRSYYTFDDSTLITSYSNSLQYSLIKNDFYIWGEKSQDKMPFRYHLAIDNKNKELLNQSTFGPFFAQQGSTASNSGYKVYKCIDIESSDILQTFKTGLEETFYRLNDNAKTTIYKWGHNTKDDELKNTLSIIPYVRTDGVNNYIYDYANNSTVRSWINVNNTTSFPDFKIDVCWGTNGYDYPTDWRTYKYLQGVRDNQVYSPANYYYSELHEEWWKIYDVLANNGAGDWLINAENGYDYVTTDFFLDFIDTSAAIGQFSIDNIGKRTCVIEDQAINCMVEPDVPDVIIIRAIDDNSSEEEVKMYTHNIQFAIDNLYYFTIVDKDFYDKILGTDIFVGAFETVQNALYQYTQYNSSITMSTVPIYYLEPNTRITVRDSRSGIYGDYIINSFSIDFSTGGEISFSCTQVLSRI